MAVAGVAAAPLKPARPAVIWQAGPLARRALQVDRSARPAAEADFRTLVEPKRWVRASHQGSRVHLGATNDAHVHVDGFLDVGYGSRQHLGLIGRAL
jgi:hypothetical protein